MKKAYPINANCPAYYFHRDCFKFKIIKKTNHW